MASAHPFGPFVAPAGASRTRPSRSSAARARGRADRFLRAGLFGARFVLLTMGLWALAACAPQGDLQTTVEAPAADAPTAASAGDGRTFYRHLLELGSVTVHDPSARRSHLARAEQR